jgi:hypothetical protein
LVFQALWQGRTESFRSKAIEALLKKYAITDIWGEMMKEQLSEWMDYPNYWEVFLVSLSLEISAIIIFMVIVAFYYFIFKKFGVEVTMVALARSHARKKIKRRADKAKWLCK